MKRLAAIICLSTLAPLLFAATSYEELLALALSSDNAQKRLDANAERAKIACEQAELARRAPSIKLQTGAISATLASTGLVLGAAPAASVGLADGAAIGASASVVGSSAGPYASLSASLGLPLERGADDKLLAAMAARAAYATADAARLRGRLEAELQLDQALAAVLQAEASLKSAERARANAQRELERAVKVDGAEPGGTTYASLSRTLRSAQRAARDALAAKVKALAALRRVVAPSGGLDDADLVPAELPDRPLGEMPKGLATTYKVASADAAAKLGADEAREKAKKNKLTPKIGASYGLGSYAAASAASSAGAGSGGTRVGLSAGLGAELGERGLSIDVGLGWQQGSGPSLGLSLSWSPSPEGYQRLVDEDAGLGLELLRLDAEDARLAAAADLEDLAASRASLERAGRDAEEDLAYAEADLAAYRRARASGFASDADYEEALAARDECAARALSAKLDRITWNCRAALAVAGAEAFGGTQ